MNAPKTPETVSFFIVQQGLIDALRPFKVTLPILGTLAIPMASILLWTYLTSIGRVDLFLPSLSNGSGLIAILIGSALVLCGILLTLIGPAYFLCGLDWMMTDLGMTEKELKGISLAPPAIAIIMITVIFLADLCEKLYKTSFGNISWLSLALSLFISMATALLFIRTSAMPDQSLRARVVKRICCGFLLWAASVITLLPADVAIRGNYVDSNWSILFAYLSACLLATLSLIPGYIYIGRANRTNLEPIVIKHVTYAMLVFFAVTCLLVPKIFSIAVNSLSVQIGIKDKASAVFLIRTEGYSHKSFKIGWQSTVISEAQYTIRAVNIFSFGDLFVLCPEVLAEADSKTLAAQSLQQCRPMKSQYVSRWS
ncbi:hypothetical protein QWZ03_09910 [Chitinimonas viridis]|uniref:Uncharacterized protein n=1 Tax=Chitinimonas viridis TaxID=664880 RepID=A0ABT8B6D0_9NEIS|nr:hypothetical protein [Chitinimonas viridis]MDN3577079.1 hypothetical protein [Chitinimonas viridis]